MRARDALGDSGQGTIGLPVVIEAVFRRGDDMGAASPFAHQPCAGAHLGAVVGGDPTGLGEGLGQGPKPPPPPWRALRGPVPGAYRRCRASAGHG